MSKPKGSVRRKPQDRVKVLIGWLAEEKARLVRETGCPMCDGVALPPMGDLHNPAIRQGLDDYWDTWTQPAEYLEARFNPCDFYFMHVTPGDDDFRVSDGPRKKGMTRERLQEEINKCTLMCKGCARNFHKRDQNWEMIQDEPEEKEPKEEVPEGVVPCGEETSPARTCKCPNCGHQWEDER